MKTIKITIEGKQGSGKTLAAELINKALRKHFSIAYEDAGEAVLCEEPREYNACVVVLPNHQSTKVVKS